MIELRVMVVCAESGERWFKDGGPAKCDWPDHTHLEFEVHVHRTEITLPDGAVVTVVSFDERDPYARHTWPAFGLYFDERWRPPWDHDHIDWPDFGVPAQIAPLSVALLSLLERAHGGERVELGCLGGHGRTGTALACLVVLTGQPQGDAVGWVRATYCADAIESDEQEAFVAKFADEVRRGS
jgi:hypothetical protein